MMNFLKNVVVEFSSPTGNFGRIQFLTGESLRAILLAICYLFYLINWKIAAALLLPYAIWVGVVATIKRFNDLQLNPLYILLSLEVIAGGFGIAWQTSIFWLAFIGLGPYLLWVSLTPGLSASQQNKH